ncbi:MAG: hypothetical protein LBQ47_07300 [Endomicrobium sp.]|jgi:heptosyltransferase-2|nr:hypothetical protein [Endomicrobium sp.]
MLNKLKRKILLFLGNPQIAGFNPRQAKSFLIFPAGALGDALVVTPLIRDLRKKYPFAKIYVMTRKRNADIFRENPFITACIDYKIRSFIKLRNQIDVFADFNIFIRIKSFILYRILNPKYFITHYKEPVLGLTEKDFSVYKNYVCPSLRIHTLEIYISYFKEFGVEYDGKGYDLQIGQRYLQNAEAFWKKNKIRIIFNIFGSYLLLDEALSGAVIKDICARYDGKIDIALLWQKDTKDLVLPLLSSDKDCLSRNCRLTLETNVKQLFALIKTADLVISIDTGVVHIAGAFNKNQVSFFSPSKSVEWAPLGKNTRIALCSSRLAGKKSVYSFDCKEAFDKIDSAIGEMQAFDKILPAISEIATEKDNVIYI